MLVGEEDPKKILCGGVRERIAGQTMRSIPELGILMYSGTVWVLLAVCVQPYLGEILSVAHQPIISLCIFCLCIIHSEGIVCLSAFPQKNISYVPGTIPGIRHYGYSIRGFGLTSGTYSSTNSKDLLSSLFGSFISSSFILHVIVL